MTVFVIIIILCILINIFSKKINELAITGNFVNKDRHGLTNVNLLPPALLLHVEEQTSRVVTKDHHEPLLHIKNDNIILKNHLICLYLHILK